MFDASVNDQSKQNSGDRQMTRSRQELKFLVPSMRTAALRRFIDERIPRHHLHQSSNILRYSTTIYFDTAERDIFKLNRNSKSAIKLRAREYYEIVPGLAELATESLHPVRDISTLWLELKWKQDERTEKHRFAIPKSEVPGLFQTGAVTDAVRRLHNQQYGQADEEGFRELERLCTRFSSPLRADCIVNYRRRAWQDDEHGTRVTLDTQLGTFEPPANLWSRTAPLTRHALGRPTYSQQAAVLELKSTTERAPDWFETVAQAFDLSPAVLPDLGDAAYSKFLASSDQLHGDPLPPT